MRDLGLPYAAWKTQAAQELELRQAIRAKVMVEAIWRQF
jgi:hypothetical protein